MIIRLLSRILVACTLAGLAAPAAGQGAVPTSRPATRPASAPAGEQEMIQLTFADNENIELRTLVNYVADRLKLNILFAEDLLGAPSPAVPSVKGAEAMTYLPRRRVAISSPMRIPKDSLLGLLQSVLKMSGLALVDAEQPGWKKIVPSQDLGSVTTHVQRDPRELATVESGTIVTQVFTVHNVSPLLADQLVRPFLSKPGGNVLALHDRNLLIVTDYAGNVKRAADLIELLESGQAKPAVRFVPLKHAGAVDLARQVTEVLTEQAKLQNPQATGPAGLTLLAEPRANQVVVISGDEAQSGQAEALIAKFDLPEAEHVATNVRYYKLVNTTAANVLATIKALESGEQSFAAPLDRRGSSVSPAGGAAGAAGLAMTNPDDVLAGPNRLPPPVGSTELPLPPSYSAASQPAAGRTAASPPGPAAGSASLTHKARDVQVAADPNTNTIIVIAPASVQAMYKELIAVLDKRRPQVMVEVTLVAIDTTDSISLGVELARQQKFGENQYLVFSSFGLSDVDTTTGSLAIHPGTGFNGVLLAPDSLNVVIKALAASNKARIVSAPKILVNDNATGKLQSVAEQPFTSINAGQTIATTSFAGYATAGTTITVTPHISEGEHLQLQYSVTLSSFTGSGSAGIPPPKNTNAIDCEVTLPNGFAVVVGGLNRKDLSQTANRVPLLGDIPILGYLFGSRTKSDTNSTLFAFIRPVILRDDQFEDLKFLSDTDLNLAELPANLPSSQPLVMP